MVPRRQRREHRPGRLRRTGPGPGGRRPLGDRPLRARGHQALDGGAAAGHYYGLHDFGGRPYAECSPYEENSDDTLFYAFDPADGTTRRLTTLKGSVTHVGTLDGRLVFARWSEDDDTSLGDTAYTGLVLVDPDTGAAETRKLAQDQRGELSLAHGTLFFVTSSGQVTSVSPRTGKLLWQTRTTLEQPGEPVADQQGRTVYLASASGRVAALDVAGGTLLWESYPRADHLGNGGWPSAEVFLNGGAPVVSTPDGTVFSVDPAHPERKPAPG